MNSSSNNQFLPTVRKDTFLKIQGEAQNNGCFHGFPIKNYSGIDEFIIHVVHKGESRHLHFLNEKFSINEAIEASSLRAMVSSGFKDVQVVEIVKSLFKKLIAHFPKPEEFPLDEFAWFVYSSYGHLSLLGLIIFSVRCEKNHYVNERRHYFGKGIQEWMLKEWLKSFDIEREEIIKANSLRKREELQNDIKIESELVDAMISKTQLAINKKKQHFILRNRANEAMNKLSNKDQFIKIYHKYELSIEPKYFDKSTKELKFKTLKHCKMLTEKWGQDFIRVNSKGTEAEKRSYIDLQFKIARLQVEKKYRNLNALSYLYSSLSSLIKVNQLTQGKEVMKLILNSENIDWNDELKSTQLRIIKHVFVIANKRWIQMEKKVLKGEVEYINSEYFQKVFIWKWVHKYCYPHLKTSTK